MRLAEIAGKVYRSAKSIAHVLTCFGFEVADYEIKVYGHKDGQTGQRKLEGGDNL